jgi:hypothetical protein
MFEARLEQGQLIKKVIEAIKDLVTDANLECSPEALTLQASGRRRGRGRGCAPPCAGARARSRAVRAGAGAGAPRPARHRGICAALSAGGYTRGTPARAAEARSARGTTRVAQRLSFSQLLLAHRLPPPLRSRPSLPQAMDSSHVSLVALKLKASGFTE